MQGSPPPRLICDIALHYYYYYYSIVNGTVNFSHLGKGFIRVTSSVVNFYVFYVLRNEQERKGKLTIAEMIELRTLGGWTV